MVLLITALGGLGLGVGVGFLVSLWVQARLLPQIVSAVGVALLNPGSEEVVEQPQQQVFEDLLKDITAQMEPEPLPRDLDWMEQEMP